MSSSSSDCKVESVVTIDSKGQIVLPKKLRERAGFKQNEKIALVTCEKEGRDLLCHFDQSGKTKGCSDRNSKYDILRTLFSKLWL